MGAAVIGAGAGYIASPDEHKLRNSILGGVGGAAFGGILGKILTQESSYKGPANIASHIHASNLAHKNMYRKPPPSLA